MLKWSLSCWTCKNTTCLVSRGRSWSIDGRPHAEWTFLPLTRRSVCVLARQPPSTRTAAGSRLRPPRWGLIAPPGPWAAGASWAPDSACYSSGTQWAYTKREIRRRRKAAHLFRVWGKTCEKSPDAHRDICKRRPHHEVEDPGLQLQDVGRREHDPGSGQNKEEDRREEGQESFVKAVVLQRVAAVSSATEGSRQSDGGQIQEYRGKLLAYFRTL